MAADKMAADKMAADKITADRIAHKIAVDRIAAKIAADRIAANKMAADRMAADKIAADKMAADKMAAENKATDNPPADAVHPNIIQIQVGERTFTTTRSCLNQCILFQKLLADHWNVPLFIEADGGLFEHILRYLRRGHFPLFYTQKDGHDCAMYAALLQEAQFYGIPRLIAWLREERYFTAVTTHVSASVSTSVFRQGDVPNVSFGGNDDGSGGFASHTDVAIHPAWSTRKVFLCPRAIPCHRGNPGKCDKLCVKERGYDGPTYEDELVLTTLMIKTKTVLDVNVCYDD